MRVKRYQNSAALHYYMRRTNPFEPSEPIEPAEPLSHAIKGRHAPSRLTLNLAPLFSKDDKKKKIAIHFTSAAYCLRLRAGRAHLGDTAAAHTANDRAAASFEGSLGCADRWEYGRGAGG